MHSVWTGIIEQLMKDARISQRELSRRSGVGRSALRRMLAGNDPTLSVLERVLDVLEYDLDAIPRPPRPKYRVKRNDCKTAVEQCRKPEPPRLIIEPHFGKLE